MSKDEQSPTFETALFELENLVKQLEDGRMPLDEAIFAFEKGTQLRKFCEEKLMSAKLKVDQILTDHDGTLRTEEFATS